MFGMYLSTKLAFWGLSATSRTPQSEHRKMMMKIVIFAQTNGSKKLIKKSARAEISIPADSVKVDPKDIYSLVLESLHGWTGG